MLDVKVRPQARRDLREIWRFSKKTWSSKQAEMYAAKLSAAIDELRAKPERGRACDTIRPGLRRRAAERHVIYYRVDNKQLIVERVLHASMDPLLHLANDQT